MCGIAGLLYKTPAGGPLGRDLLKILGCLNSRGVDSTGLALYGPPSDSLVLTLWLPGRNGSAAQQAELAAARAAEFARVQAVERRADYLRLQVEYEGDVAVLADALERAAPGIQVFSAGRSLEIVKQTGGAVVLAERYAIGDFVGTHGIGHTRLATESRVDISHSHPFWARPTPDIAVVHNGQITNYHKLRRRMEMKGVRFQTENDSEIIGLYLVERMQQTGESLEEAMRASVEELDGTFTYLVATADALGFAKDAFATKPLVVAETEAYVALASEDIALRRFVPREVRAWEPPAREVRVWRR